MKKKVEREQEKNDAGLATNLTAEVQNKMSNLTNMIEKIKSLEAEKKSLLLEIEKSEKMAEARVAVLKSEIDGLRGTCDDVESLKILIDRSQPSVQKRQSEVFKGNLW